MNIYEVSCGVYRYFKIAKTGEEAVQAVQEEQHLEHLPLQAEEIPLEGYKLVKR